MHPDIQAVLLGDGSVLVTGGGNAESQTAAEIWEPLFGQWAPVAPLPNPKINFGLARYQGGRVLAFGGSVNSTLTFVNGTSSTYTFTIPFTAQNLAEFLPDNSTAPAPGEDLSL